MPNKRGGESEKMSMHWNFPEIIINGRSNGMKICDKVLTVIFHKTYRKICLAPAKKRNWSVYYILFLFVNGKAFFKELLAFWGAYSSTDLIRNMQSYKWFKWILMVIISETVRGRTFRQGFSWLKMQTYWQ